MNLFNQAMGHGKDTTYGVVELLRSLLNLRPSDELAGGGGGEQRVREVLRGAGWMANRMDEVGM